MADSNRCQGQCHVSENQEYMSLDTPLLHVLQPFKGYLAIVKIFFALSAQSYHFSCSSNERMTN